MSENKEEVPSVVALQYDGAQAPKVIAKGKGLVAEQILAMADEYGIPLREDPDLVTLLSQLELGTEIPSNLYVAVAEVLAFAYMMSGKEAPTPDKTPE